MGFLNALFGGANLNEQVNNARKTPGAKIIDVRTAGEFAAGHIPGAINVPLSDFSRISKRAPKVTQPLYLYCASGSRSGRAAGMARSMGYENVVNMGGIGAWSGPLER